MAANTETKGALSRRAFLTAGSLLAARYLTGDSVPYMATHERQKVHYEPRIVRFEEEDVRGAAFVLPPSDFRGTEHGRYIPFPTTIGQHLVPQIQLVNSVLKPKDHVLGLSLTKINPNSMHDGTKKYINSFPNYGKPDINFDMYPGIKFYYGDMARIVFHESMHRLNDLGNRRQDLNEKAYDFYGWLYQHPGTDQLPYEINPSRYESHSIDQPINLVKQGLFPLFDESSYAFRRDTSLGSIGRDQGHPYDDPDELLASTLNVLRHFPRGFMASVDTLPPKLAEPVKDFTRFVLKQSQLASANPENFMRLFSPQLFRYLNN